MSETSNVKAITDTTELVWGEVFFPTSPGDSDTFYPNGGVVTHGVVVDKCHTKLNHVSLGVKRQQHWVIQWDPAKNIFYYTGEQLWFEYTSVIFRTVVEPCECYFARQVDNNPVRVDRSIKHPFRGLQ